jgi:hypothetical protein
MTSRCLHRPTANLFVIASKLRLRLVLLDVLFLHDHEVIVDIGSLLLLRGRLLGIVGIFWVGCWGVGKLRCEFRGFGRLFFLSLGIGDDRWEEVTGYRSVYVMKSTAAGTHGIFLK